MITEPISFTGKLTLQDRLDLDDAERGYATPPWVDALLTAASLTILAYILWRWHTGFDWKWLPGFLFFLWVPFGSRLRRRRYFRRSYQQHPEYFPECTVTVTHETVSLSYPPEEVRLLWTNFYGIACTSKGLAFMLNEREALFWLPQSLFEQNSHLDQILAQALDHGLSIRRFS